MSEAADDLATKWDGLLFDVRRSVRYHTARRRFFDRLDQLTSMLGLVFGSTTVYGVMEKSTDLQPLAISAAAIVTVFSAINLVVGSAQKARQHADFAREFVDLEKRMNATPSEQLLQEITHARLAIEAEEPPILRVLDCICYNELCQALGRKQRAEIGDIQRLFAQIVDIRPDKIKVKELHSPQLAERSNLER